MEIKLTGKHEGIALVSLEDYDELSKYDWYKDDQGYIRSTINKKSVKMHRYIMKANENEIVDHINSKPYDNRRENLRKFTVAKNAQTRKKNKGVSGSKFRGVSYNSKENKYMARLRLNGKTFYLGLHKKEADAAEAVDMYLVHNNGCEHIPLNFPNKKETYLKRKYIPYRIKKPNKTKYRGITKRKYSYQATITINKKVIHIGNSKDLKECAKMWDKYVVENNILHRKLNFPEDYPDYNPNVIKTKCEVIDDTTIRLLIDSFPEKIVLIDKEDYDKVKYYAWYINKRNYVIAEINGKCHRIHRFLTNTTDPNIYIDHFDSNPLNNTKNNLRVSCKIKNGRNKIKQDGCISDYIGIKLGCGVWYSFITYNGEYKPIGKDIIEEYAARRRDLFILDKYPDEQYKLNFEWTNHDIYKWKKILKKPIKNSYINTVDNRIKEIMFVLLNDDLMRVKKLNICLNNKIHNCPYQI